ncbi:MAG: 1-(5-phosphoribosyl)-5-[(5-phosphoribosylamino)methylideneamino]imidazole-4-carboxamide isomerase [Methylacidiphilales bacterium]|nr:1-(5-phosphoribosyl)-5-[(5-phosphoribosylamino)methylideneamino]imidazole-4-carboxamide isomerase [Candidatus Methylacidiphilales bacterium]
MTFQIIPSIDLINGAVVRLTQGDYQKQTNYPADPEQLIHEWYNHGLRRIHIVDLDGAKEGVVSPLHFNFITKICKQHDQLQIQIGGGIRSQEQAKRYFQAGVSFIVIGTLLQSNPILASELVNNFPNQVFLGFDCKGEFLAVKGWTQQTNISLETLVAQYETQPSAGIIFTDITKDGMGQGTNITSITKLCKMTSKSVIASGGIGSITDINTLQNLRITNLNGVIIGKALHDSSVTIEQIKSSNHAAH